MRKSKEAHEAEDRRNTDELYTIKSVIRGGEGREMRSEGWELPDPVGHLKGKRLKSFSARRL